MTSTVQRSQPSTLARHGRSTALAQHSKHRRISSRRTTGGTAKEPRATSSPTSSPPGNTFSPVECAEFSAHVPSLLRSPVLPSPACATAVSLGPSCPGRSATAEHSSQYLSSCNPHLQPWPGCWAGRSARSARARCSPGCAPPRVWWPACAATDRHWTLASPHTRCPPPQTQSSRRHGAPGGWLARRALGGCQFPASGTGARRASSAAAAAPHPGCPPSRASGSTFARGSAPGERNAGRGGVSKFCCKLQSPYDNAWLQTPSPGRSAPAQPLRNSAVSTRHA